MRACAVCKRYAVSSIPAAADLVSVFANAVRVSLSVSLASTLKRFLPASIFWNLRFIRSFGSFVRLYAASVINGCV